MKKTVLFSMAVLVILSMVLSACAPAATPTAKPTASHRSVTVAVDRSAHRDCYPRWAD